MFIKRLMPVLMFIGSVFCFHIQPSQAQVDKAWVVTTCGTAPSGFSLSGSGYPAGGQYPVTMDINGNLCIGSSGGGGTVTALQGTTPWVDNITQFGGNNVVTGTGAGGNGIPRVTVSNDSTVGLVAGSAIIGRVGIDQTTPGTTNGVVTNSGSVTAATQSGTWSDTVTQATASNLNAQVVGNIASGSSDSGNPVKVGGVFNTSTPTLTNTQRGDLQVDSQANLRTLEILSQSAAADGTGNNSGGVYIGQSNGTTKLYAQVWPFNYNGTTWDRQYSASAANATTGTGVIAAGAMGVYNSTEPTYTNTQYGNAQLDTRGSLNVTLKSNNGASAIASATPTSDALANANGLYTDSQNLLFNGSTWERDYSIDGQGGAGVGVQAVAIAPNSIASGALLSQQCTVACASSIVSGAHNLYGLNLSSTTTGWFLLEDATSCAANGTITPKRAWAYPTANTTLAVSYGGLPTHQSTGIAICFSTTGPYSATASTTAFIGIDYQ